MAYVDVEGCKSKKCEHLRQFYKGEVISGRDYYTPNFGLVDCRCLHPDVADKKSRQNITTLPGVDVSTLRKCPLKE